jgi:hypothetical protein
MVPMGYSGARGTLIYEKNLMLKISCQTPFKRMLNYSAYNFKAHSQPVLISFRKPILSARLSNVTTFRQIFI